MQSRRFAMAIAVGMRGTDSFVLWRLVGAMFMEWAISFHEILALFRYVSTLLFC